MAVQPVVEVIIRVPGTVLNDVVFHCPDLTWHEIFLTIDRLRREGTLTLTPKGQGHYLVQVSDQAAVSIYSLAAAYCSPVCEESSIPSMDGA